MYLGDFMTKFKRNFDFDDNIIETIAYNVIKYRKINGITQEHLAELANVSTSLIGNLESKKTYQGISIYNLYKISKILNVPIEYFFIDR